jgi:protein arginine N-methyltransferase 5
MPMYREPVEESKEANISSLDMKTPTKTEGKEIDLLSAWDSWHHVRSVCNYNTRLFVCTFI